MTFHRQVEDHKESLSAQTSKIKKLFLKEYEQLINEKNEEIKHLQDQLTQANFDNKDLRAEIKGKFGSGDEVIELKQQVKGKEEVIAQKDLKLKGNGYDGEIYTDFDLLESRAKVNPILKEGLLNMEKCNKISSNLLMQYKEHIIQLSSQNAGLTKKIKEMGNLQERFEEVTQQNELYEQELKALEDNVKLIEEQVDRQQCVSSFFLNFSMF